MEAMSSLVLPEGHGWQVVPLEKLPATHMTQKSPFRPNPGRHVQLPVPDTHSVLPCASMEPGGQPGHGMGVSEPLQNEPAGHVVGVVLASGQYVPRGHRVAFALLSQ